MRRSVAPLIAAGAIAVTVLVGSARPATAQSWRTLTSTRQSTGEEQLDVRLEYGAGRLSVEPAEPGLLYRIQVHYDEERSSPIVEFDRDRLELGLNFGDGFRFGNPGSENELNVSLSREAVLDLRMEFGAVRADIELGGLSLSDLSISTGASDSRISVSEPNPTPLGRAQLDLGAASFVVNDLGNLNAERIDIDAGLGEVVLRFTGDWRRDADVSVDMGLGSLRLVFPRDLGVRLRQETFLSSFDHDGFVRRGEYYYSPSWSEAERRVTLDVNAALGSIDAVWAP